MSLPSGPEQPVKKLFSITPGDPQTYRAVLVMAKDWAALERYDAWTKRYAIRLRELRVIAATGESRGSYDDTYDEYVPSELQALVRSNQ